MAWTWRCQVALLLLLGLARLPSGQGKLLPPQGHAQAVDTVVVDLDLPARLRWQKVILPYRQAMAPVVQFLHNLLPPNQANATYQALEAIVVYSISTDSLEGDYGEEIRGLAEATNFTVGEIMLSNFFYELNSGCTSILATDEQNTIFHGRNLDYNQLPGLQATTFNVNFTKSGCLLFRTTTYAGYIGALTGMKPGAFTVSMDQRFTNSSTLLNIVEAALLGGHEVGLTLRTALEHNATFEDAVEYLGSVTPTRWYLVETNYDHWDSVPADDDRRHPAENMLNAFSMTNMTLSALDGIMNTFPVLHRDTTYTTMMRRRRHWYVLPDRPVEGFSCLVTGSGMPGILFPNIQTPEAAVEAIRNCYYPSATLPFGTRGFGFGGANADGSFFAEYAAAANERIVVGVQLEHRTAFEQARLEAILSTPGLIFTQDGPYDHSGSYLLPGRTDHPNVQADLARYRQACQAAGVVAGYRFIALGTDMIHLMDGCRAALANANHHT
ncbi:uncharacterized protein MONBRDRAFT_11809 [Monosiga brevicollis MX1]|uniref:Acid ceramidase N-terminal domain-containing protein n=1 Tax=Monosiga brevicollis TaxID=81824 RepID=A9VAC1_MONBE|nr:uncharacterized protein MONBRDRAFT_11809 [Monosiga brevicollis MX1]EDQ85515.1 predicted protein [Monosiga brevicollis MX1]|eukprot:XP_001749706.1 hypothetical protein [Monosiga brevicollis MX1]